jgi:hypothetical protein
MVTKDGTKRRFTTAMFDDRERQMQRRDQPPWIPGNSCPDISHFAPNARFTKDIAQMKLLQTS